MILSARGEAVDPVDQDLETGELYHVTTSSGEVETVDALIDGHVINVYTHANTGSWLCEFCERSRLAITEI